MNNTSSAMTPEYLFNHCKTHNIRIDRIGSVSGILTLVKTFTPGDLRQYAMAESDTSIIYHVPHIKSNSSVWGTTGDTIGGYSGVQHGEMRINRSACKKTFLKELKKLMLADGITAPEAD